MERFERILACTDFSETGDRGIRKAFGLCNEATTKLILAHVADPPPLPNPMYAHYCEEHPWDHDVQTKIEAKAKAGLEALVPEAFKNLQVELVYEVPHGAIVECIFGLVKEHDADLLVVGTHGRSGIERILLGSVTERIVRLAPCPVLVVH